MFKKVESTKKGVIKSSRRRVKKVFKQFLEKEVGEVISNFSNLFSRKYLKNRNDRRLELKNDSKFKYLEKKEYLLLKKLEKIHKKLDVATMSEVCDINEKVNVIGGKLKPLEPCSEEVSSKEKLNQTTNPCAPVAPANDFALADNIAKHEQTNENQSELLDNATVPEVCDINEIINDVLDGKLKPLEPFLEGVISSKENSNKTKDDATVPKLCDNNEFANVLVDKLKQLDLNQTTNPCPPVAPANSPVQENRTQLFALTSQVVANRVKLDSAQLIDLASAPIEEVLKKTEYKPKEKVIKLKARKPNTKSNPISYTRQEGFTRKIPRPVNLGQKNSLSQGSKTGKRKISATF